MSPRLPSPEQIEQLLSRDSTRGPLTVRQIAAAFDLPAGKRPALRRMVQSLVDGERIVAVRGRRFATRGTFGDTVGRFARHRAGFGFVTPDDPQQDDLFIPAEAQSGAMHGDVVAVRLVNVKPDGRREGKIVRIVERKSSRLIGIFQPTFSGGGMVQPLDPGYGFEVLVKKGQTGAARGGEVVSVELEAYPQGARPARGPVIERLGLPDEPGVDIEILVRKYDLPQRFPDEVEAEARALPGRPEAWPLDGRVDFTGQAVVTIDGETAKDFDDAVSVERRPGGGFRLHVHIADVDHFVAEDSALDREALRRGTSVYFPGRVVPMLPERLSNDLCSLVPGEVRLTQGISIEYDSTGRTVGAETHEGVIRSRARLTYAEVADLLEGRHDTLPGGSPELASMLEAAGALSSLLAARRGRRGAIDFDLPEPEMLFALTGETTEIVARSRNPAHRLIEEFMIAANEAIAVALVRGRRPALYRVHEAPDPARVARLAEAISGLGYAIPDTPDAVAPRDLARIVKAAETKPEEPFIQRMVLRTMALARYDVECLGHFGLALKRYLHFTSPIRRYPDLVVHRALRRLRRGVRLRSGERAEMVARLPELARECSRLERFAEAAEREAIAWKMAAFMAERLGEEFAGRIVDIAAHGVTVLIDEPFVEGLIPIRRLGSEYFRYNLRRRALEGVESGQQFRLGQTVAVRVDRVDLVRHWIDLSPVEPSGSAERPSRTGRERRPPRRRSGSGRSRPSRR